jgi:hypothetical protein
MVYRHVYISAWGGKAFIRIKENKTVHNTKSQNYSSYVYNIYLKTKLREQEHSTRKKTSLYTFIFLRNFFWIRTAVQGLLCIGGCLEVTGLKFISWAR